MMKTWQKWAIGLGSLLVVYLVLAIISRPAELHPFFLAPGRFGPLVIAHQGGEGLRPSNTMEAFEYASGIGADVLEMDVHSTRDGVLVVIHDDTVDRTTDGSGRVQDFTFDELQALDAGYYWTADNGVTYPYRGQGITIPSLEEVLRNYPEFRMNIEIKQETPSIRQPLCDLLRQNRLEKRVLVASFNQRAMNDFRKVCPEVATSAVQNEVILFFAFKTLLLAPTYSPTAYAVQVPEYRFNIHVLTEGFVKTAHSRGLQVHAWTINEVDDMKRLLDLGVDGIITDYPDRMLELLRNR
jgi:glycerophosphoryl diester phosphodiesterase